MAAHSFGSSPRQASHDTFLDHGAFKLGKYAKDLKHRATGRRGRVETLLMQVEIDALGVKILEDELLRAGFSLLAQHFSTLLLHLGGEWLRTMRITQLDAARLGSRQRLPCALRNFEALLLGNS